MQNEEGTRVWPTEEEISWNAFKGLLYGGDHSGTEPEKWYIAALFILNTGFLGVIQGPDFWPIETRPLGSMKRQDETFADYRAEGVCKR